MHTSNNLCLNFSTNLIESVICKMSQNDHQRRTQLDPNAAHVVPTQQQNVPIPLQILADSPQQLNLSDDQLVRQQNNNSMKFPKQNVGPQNESQHHFPKLSQINSGSVILGEIL